MDIAHIMQLLTNRTDNILVKFISDKGENTCDVCLKFHGKTFQIDDQEKPELPIHPNCKCKYVLVDNPTVDVTASIEKEKIFQNILSSSNLSEDEAKQLADQIINAKKSNEKIRYQKLFLFFNGSKLISSDGKLILNAVSGIPVSKTENFYKLSVAGPVKQITQKVFDYSSRRQGEENQGGVPQGLYSIDCKESGSLLNGNLKKHGFGVNAWGNYHWLLIPDKATDMRGRKPLSFTIHGGKVAQSAGCIDLTSQDTTFRNYLQSTGFKKIYIFVQYAQEIVIFKEELVSHYPFIQVQ